MRNIFPRCSQDGLHERIAWRLVLDCQQQRKTAHTFKLGSQWCNIVYSVEERNPDVRFAVVRGYFIGREVHDLFRHFCSSCCQAEFFSSSEVLRGLTNEFIIQTKMSLHDQLLADLEEVDEEDLAVCALHQFIRNITSFYFYDAFCFVLRLEFSYHFTHATGRRSRWTRGGGRGNPRN